MDGIQIHFGPLYAWQAIKLGTVWEMGACQLIVPKVAASDT
jgi:hypothetical protein